MGLSGKPDVISGADVENYVREGRIAEVAAYCETDVVNTYRVWLRYELFRGRLTENGLRASEANLSDYIRSRSNTKPHLAYVQAEEKITPTECQILIEEFSPKPRMRQRSNERCDCPNRSI